MILVISYGPCLRDEQIQHITSRDKWTTSGDEFYVANVQCECVWFNVPLDTL